VDLGHCLVRQLAGIARARAPSAAEADALSAAKTFRHVARLAAEGREGTDEPSPEQVRAQMITMAMTLINIGGTDLPDDPAALPALMETQLAPLADRFGDAAPDAADLLTGLDGGDLLGAMRYQRRVLAAARSGDGVAMKERLCRDITLTGAGAAQ
jgi:hypothetical protein